MEYTQCANQLNALKVDLKLANAWLLQNYAVHSIDFTGVPFDAVNALDRAVTNLANDFSTGSQNSFDKTKSCAVCGEIGHIFFLIACNCRTMKRLSERIFAYRVL